jgi:hypothetical protein
MASKREISQERDAQAQLGREGIKDTSGTAEIFAELVEAADDAGGER